MVESAQSPSRRRIAAPVLFALAFGLMLYVVPYFVTTSRQNIYGHDFRFFRWKWQTYVYHPLAVLESWVSDPVLLVDLEPEP